MNGRMYDPFQGRFLSPDPYVQDPLNPLNHNRYTYCLNNPTKYTDPSGEIIPFIAVVAIVAVASGGINLACNWKNVDNFGDGLYYFGVGAAVGAAATVGGAALAPVIGTGAIAGGLLGASSGFVTGFANTAYTTHGDWEAMWNSAGKGALWGGIGGAVVAGAFTGLNGNNVWTGANPSRQRSIWSLKDITGSNRGPSFHFKDAYSLKSKNFWKYGHTNPSTKVLEHDANGKLVSHTAAKDGIAGASQNDPKYNILGETCENADGTYTTIIEKEPYQVFTGVKTDGSPISGSGFDGGTYYKFDYFFEPTYFHSYAIVPQNYGQGFYGYFQIR